MLTKKEFNALTLMERTGKSFSQRELSEALGVSLGTANKLSKELHDKQLCDGGHITDGGLAALEPYRVRRAVFIAAGFGSRLVPITFNTPSPSCACTERASSTRCSTPLQPPVFRRSSSSAATSVSSSTSFCISIPESGS